MMKKKQQAELKLKLQRSLIRALAPKDVASVAGGIEPNCVCNSHVWINKG